MSSTATCGTAGSVREALKRMVDGFDTALPPAFTRAVKSLLAAMDYDDPALIRSHLNEAFESLRDVINEAIEKRLGWPQRAKEDCRRIFEAIEAEPAEHFDELGRALGAFFDKLLKGLTDLRDGPVRLLTEDGYELENAPHLERAIRELTDLKNSTLEDWPWSDREPPPLNRKMVADSMAAIARGEGERIEDLIKRLS